MDKISSADGSALSRLVVMDMAAPGGPAPVRPPSSRRARWSRRLPAVFVATRRGLLSPPALLALGMAAVCLLITQFVLFGRVW
ncbi:hypothetical protein ABZ297_19080 [Nonomuraea sp. NPDC005983]|uniref:hypothetical protein n=1 Tax=Nonomuraea sp. NPDC005983 TaxID=3155595 RepID=UPI0033AB00C6